jgi:hypothetical protein
VDALGNDGNASMPEQVSRPNPWMMMMMTTTTMRINHHLQHIVGPGYNDIGLCDTSSIASDILQHQLLIPLHYIPRL